MTDLVKSATLTTAMVTDSYESGAKRVVSASNDAAAAADKVETSTTKATSSLKLSAEGWDSWLAKIDPATRAGQQYATALDTLGTYQKAGLVSSNDLAIAQGALASRFETGSVAVSGFGDILAGGAKLLGAFGLSLSVGELLSFSEGVVKTTADLADQALQTGLSVEALQAYRQVLAQSGVAGDQANSLLERLNRNIGQAAETTGPARAAFIQLGLSAADLAGGPDTALPKIAAALLAVQNSSEQARLEVALFGKSGQDVTAALSQLSKPVNDLIASMNVLDDTLVANTKEATERSQGYWHDWYVTVAKYIDEIKVGMNQTPQEFMTRDTTNPAMMNSSIPQVKVTPEWSSLTPGTTNPFGGGGGFPTPDLSKFIAQMQLAADLAKETTDQRKLDQDIITAATDKIKDEGLAQQVQITSLQQAKSILGDQSVALITNAEHLDTLNQLYGEGAERLAEIRDNTAGIGQWNDKWLASLLKIPAISDAVLERQDKELSNQQMLGNKQASYLDQAIGKIQEEAAAAALLPQYRDADLAIMQLQLKTGKDLSDQDKQRIQDAETIKQRNQDIATAEQANESSFADWLKTTETTGKASFSSLFTAILGGWQDMLNKMIAQWVGSQLFSGGASGGSSGGGIGGLLSSLFGGGGGGLSPVGFSSFSLGSDPLAGLTTQGLGATLGFASGGRPPVGVASLVGENGPELFVPDSAGTVLPNYAMNDNGPSNGGKSVNVNVTINAPGATSGTVEQMRAVATDIAAQVVAAAAPTIMSGAVKSVSNRLRNTGRVGL